MDASRRIVAPRLVSTKNPGRVKVSLGLVEGVNNKIRVLQRRAYGYRDEEYLKLKIVAAFLPPLPRNAVFNPHESA